MLKSTILKMIEIGILSEQEKTGLKLLIQFLFSKDIPFKNMEQKTFAVLYSAYNRLKGNPKYKENDIQYTIFQDFLKQNLYWNLFDQDMKILDKKFISIKYGKKVLDVTWNFMGYDKNNKLKFLEILIDYLFERINFRKMWNKTTTESKIVELNQKIKDLKLQLEGYENYYKENYF